MIQAGTGDTVHVDDQGSSYVESQVIDDGKSLVADNFDNSDFGGVTIMGNIGPTIEVSAGDTAGTISGFLLAAAATEETVFLEGPATLRDNTINNANSNVSALDISTPAGGDGTVIDHNTFNGAGSSANTGISISEGAPQITDNSISTPSNGFNVGIRVSNDSNPTIDGNTFQAIFQDGGNAGIAVYVFDAHATITDNLLNQVGTGSVSGIVIEQLSMTTGATIRRNRLFGLGIGTGVGTFANDDPVTVESTVIAGMLTGIRAQGSNGALADDGDITATNLTLADNGGDISLDNTHIDLDSSIVEDPIALSGIGNPGCTITFSRGPSTLPGACTQFQTTASPGFVSTGGLNAESNDYHLTPASMMIDAGNPAAPAAGLADMDGDPRAIDADGSCPDDPVRDIGADEFDAADLDCTAPNTTGRAKIKRRKRRATFTFSSTEAGSHFQCKLDRKPFAPCTSPKKYRKLKRRKHTFKVRAIDAAGNVDPTPLVKKFKIPRRRR